MQEYIQQLRQAGYMGWLQVFRMVRITKQGDKQIAWIDMQQGLAEQLQVGGEFSLVRIQQSYDIQNSLDFVDFIFEEGVCNHSHIEETRLQRQDSQFATATRQEAYWRPIRKYIASNTIYAIGVNAFIQNEYGEIAAVQRKDDGMWSFPAGTREIGELLQESVVKEVEEETSLVTKVDQLCYLYIFPFVLPSGDCYTYLTALYKLQLVTGELRVNDIENTQARWLSIEKAKTMFQRDWRERLGYYLDHKVGSGVLIL
ncbi:MAG: NUDIX domain-containing protein [Spirochaetota bacterium]